MSVCQSVRLSVSLSLCLSLSLSLSLSLLPYCRQRTSRQREPLWWEQEGSTNRGDSVGLVVVEGVARHGVLELLPSSRQARVLDCPIAPHRHCPGDASESLRRFVSGNCHRNKKTKGPRTGRVLTHGSGCDALHGFRDALVYILGPRRHVVEQCLVPRGTRRRHLEGARGETRKINV